MPISIEQFATTYEHTIALLGVIGTLGAVVVSLVLATLAVRANRTRLRATADLIAILTHETVENPPSFLVVTITNRGKWPLRIPTAFFHWKTPLKRECMTVFPPFDCIGNAWIARKTYPVEIAPRSSETFFLSSKTTLQSEAKRMRAANNSFLDRLRGRFIRARVQTDDGMTFRVAVAKGVRDVWRRTEVS
jgi:hypothetical protein